MRGVDCARNNNPLTRVPSLTAHSFVQNSDAGLLYTDDILVDASGRELCRQPAVHPWNMDAWLRTCNLRGDTWLARRALVMQTELHEEETEHDHDYDLFFQLLRLTTFEHVPKYLVFIRQHNGRSSGANHRSAR